MIGKTTTLGALLIPALLLLSTDGAKAINLMFAPGDVFVSLESGAVLHYELDHVSTGELSETGAGGRHLGEEDVWGRASLMVGPAGLSPRAAIR